MSPSEFLGADIERLRAQVKALRAEVQELERRVEAWEQDNLKTVPDNKIPLPPNRELTPGSEVEFVTFLEELEEDTEKISVVEGSWFVP